MNRKLAKKPFNPNRMWSGSLCNTGWSSRGGCLVFFFWTSCKLRGSRRLLLEGAGGMEMMVRGPSWIGVDWLDRDCWFPCRCCPDSKCIWCSDSSSAIIVSESLHKGQKSWRWSVNQSTGVRLSSLRWLKVVRLSSSSLLGSSWCSNGSLVRAHTE